MTKERTSELEDSSYKIIQNKYHREKIYMKNKKEANKHEEQNDKIQCMFKKNSKRAKNLRNAIVKKIMDKHDPVLERKSKRNAELPKKVVFS